LLGRAEGWWAGAAVEEGVGDDVDLIDAAAEEWAQERGDVGGSGEGDGDERFGFLDAGVCKIAYFRFDPLA
jgi:hypothetical protein